MCNKATKTLQYRREAGNISFYLNCAGVDSPANAPLAQLVESIRLITGRSLVQAQQGARFAERRFSSSFIMHHRVTG